MRYTKPQQEEQLVPFQTLKIQGGTDATIGFDFLASEPVVGRRRYCNKVLVHECVPAEVLEAIPITKAEFIATSDACYSVFEVYKTSEASDYIEASITLQREDDEDPSSDAVGVLVSFAKDETYCLPLRMTYRLYGYYPQGTRIMLSTGTLYVTPTGNAVISSSSPTVVDCGGDYWTDVDW